MQSNATMRSNVNMRYNINVDSNIRTTLFNSKQENPTWSLYPAKTGGPSSGYFKRVTIEVPTTGYLLLSLVANPTMNTSSGHAYASRITGSDQVYICGIPVEINRDKDTVIVTDSIINMYGIGHNVEEAIEDYKITVKAYYEELKESEDKLSNNLKQNLDYLNARDI